MNDDKQSLQTLLRQACANVGENGAVDMPVSVAHEFARLVRDAAATACEALAMKHQQDEGAYAAGKKAGALECAQVIRGA